LFPSCNEVDLQAAAEGVPRSFVTAPDNARVTALNGDRDDQCGVPAGDQAASIVFTKDTAMQTTDTSVIKTDGLTKTYKGVSALQDLSLTVPRHSIFGFLDPTVQAKARRSSCCSA
jgi:hypothetical protein